MASESLLDPAVVEEVLPLFWGKNVFYGHFLCYQNVAMV